MANGIKDNLEVKREKREGSPMSEKDRREAIEAMQEISRKAAELSAENAADRALNAIEAEEKSGAGSPTISEIGASVEPSAEVDEQAWELLKERFAPDAKPVEEPGEAAGLQGAVPGDAPSDPVAAAPEAIAWVLADVFESGSEGASAPREGELSFEEIPAVKEEAAPAVPSAKGAAEAAAKAPGPAGQKAPAAAARASAVKPAAKPAAKPALAEAKVPNLKVSKPNAPKSKDPEGEGTASQKPDGGQDPSGKAAKPKSGKAQGREPRKAGKAAGESGKGRPAPVPFDGCPVFGDGEDTPIVLPDIPEESLDERGKPVFSAAQEEKPAAPAHQEAPRKTAPKPQPARQPERQAAQPISQSVPEKPVAPEPAAPAPVVAEIPEPVSADAADGFEEIRAEDIQLHGFQQPVAPGDGEVDPKRKPVLKMVLMVLASVVLALLVAYIVFSVVPSSADDDTAEESSIVSSLIGSAPGLPAFERLSANPDASGDGLDSGTASDSPDFAAAEQANASGGGEKEVVFSKEAGSYDGAFDLSMTAPRGWTIHYTLDGSEPDSTSSVYHAPIAITDADSDPLKVATAQNIDASNLPEFFEAFYPESDAVAKGTVVKACAVSPDKKETTPVATATYFCGKSVAARYGGIAVVSISTGRDNLFGYKSGIMSAGSAYDTWKATDPYAPTALANQEFWVADANFKKSGREWEREGYVEIFDGSDTVSVSAPCGIRIKGDRSRYYSQKSINVYIRKEYGGKKKVSYELFSSAADPSGNTIGEYKSFSLRNGGNDAEYSKFRDAYLQSLLTGMDFGTQAQRPAILFVNGEYWGVYSLCEKWSKNMIASTYGVDSDEIVSYKGDVIDEGTDPDSELYDELMSYQYKDFKKSSVWESFKEIVDVQSMADHYAAQSYIGNEDFWPNRNSQIWRTKESGGSGYADGKWRWLMYDVEYSSGIYPAVQMDDRLSVEDDTCKVFLQNHPLFRAVMANPEFRQMYRDSLQKVADSYMEPYRALSRLMAYEAAYRPLMKDHYARFGGNYKLFDENVKALKDFVTHRAEYLLPAVDTDLAEFDDLLERVKRQTADSVGAFGESDISAAQEEADARAEAAEGIDIGAIDKEQLDSMAKDASSQEEDWENGAASGNSQNASENGGNADYTYNY